MALRSCSSLQAKVCNINFTVAENAPPNSPQQLPRRILQFLPYLSRKELSCDAFASPADASAGDPRGRCLTLKPPPEPWLNTKINFNGWEIHPRLELSASKFRTWRPSPAPSLLFKQMTDRCPPQKIAPKLVGSCWGCLKVVLQNADFPSGRSVYCGPCPVLWKQIPVVICTLQRISPVQVFPSAFPDGAESAAVRTHRNGWATATEMAFLFSFFFFFFFSGQAGQTARLRDGKQEAHLKAFPESKWWDAVGWLVAPLSPFLSSSHQSVGGGGAPIHRSSSSNSSTQHTATSHSTSNYARAADQEIVWFLQFKEISSNWVTLYKRLNAPRSALFPPRRCAASASVGVASSHSSKSRKISLDFT